MAQSYNESEILRAIECPVCYQHMMPPIHLCTTGHSICDTCRQKLSKCPKCMAPLGQGRNFTLEELVPWLRYPCPFRTNGCKIVSNYCDLEKHKEDCPYRRYICRFCTGNAPWRGYRGQLREHLKDIHAENFLEKGRKIPLDCDTKQKMFFTLCEGSVFYLKLTWATDMFFSTLEYVGPKQKAASYTYKVTISSEECDRKVEASRMCASTTQTGKEIWQDGLYTGVATDSLRSFKKPQFCVDVIEGVGPRSGVKVKSV